MHSRRRALADAHEDNSLPSPIQRRRFLLQDTQYSGHVLLEALRLNAPRKCSHDIRFRDEVCMRVEILEFLLVALSTASPVR